MIVVYINHEKNAEAQPRPFLTNNFLIFCVSSGEVKYYDNSLRLVQGMGVKGSIWLSGCVAKDCLVEHPVVEVKMTVGRDRKTIDRQETLFIRPSVYPFQVDGLLGLKRKETDRRFVTVSIKIGETASRNILSSKSLAEKVSEVNVQKSQGKVAFLVHRHLYIYLYIWWKHDFFFLRNWQIERIIMRRRKGTEEE